jgi:hypothetical protein
MSPKQTEKTDSEMLKEIHDALVGNAYTNNQGLVHKVASHDKYIEKDKKFKWTLAGMSIVVSTFLKEIIK